MPVRKGRGEIRARGTPVVLPVQALCGELAVDGSPRAVYETQIDVSYQPSGDAGTGEVVVSPDILAGEVNPGETIEVRCEDILQGKTAFAGVVTVQTYPPEGFVVRVTYRARAAAPSQGGQERP